MIEVLTIGGMIDDLAYVPFAAMNRMDWRVEDGRLGSHPFMGLGWLGFKN